MDAIQSQYEYSYGGQNFLSRKAVSINMAYPSRPDPACPFPLHCKTALGLSTGWRQPAGQPVVEAGGRKERRTSNENPPGCAGVGGHPVRARACATVALRRAESQP